VGHRLAQRMLNRCKESDTPVAELKFLYSQSTTKVAAILDNYIGKSGWLQVQQLSISSFEYEDYILLACFTDDGEQIDPEIAQRLFSIDAEVIQNIDKPEAVKIKGEEIVYQLKQDIITENLNRNRNFFDEEMDKLDQWADDMKISLEREIKDLDAEIKLRKAEAKKLLNLEAKVKAQRYIKDLEKKRSEKRQVLFSAQDDIDEKKENLLTDIERKLSQKVEQKELFTIKWRLE
jgi:hypothetical protein